MSRPTRVLVAGASGAIGSRIVNDQVLIGANVYLISGRKNIEEESSTEAIVKAASATQTISGDLSSKCDLDRIFETLNKEVAKNGSFDAVICCAGAASDRRTVDDWDRDYLIEALDNNFIGPALFVGRAKELVQKNGGVMVLVGSLAGVNGSGSGSGAYSASKAALHNLCLSFAQECKADGIRVVGVVPGLIDTQFHNEYRDKARNMAKSVCLEGRIGQPKDVSELIAFLISDKANYISGTLIRIDGGIIG